MARMVRVSVTELKNRLSEFLRRVKRGESVEILERSVVIARLEAVGPETVKGDEQLARLEREGVLRRSSPAARRALLDFAPVPCAVDAVRIALEQRGER